MIKLLAANSWSAGRMDMEALGEVTTDDLISTPDGPKMEYTAGHQVPPKSDTQHYFQGP